MSLNRGDVVLLYVPFVGSSGGKVRLALVVQNDTLNDRLAETIVAAITGNVALSHLPHRRLVVVATPDGRATGLLHDSVVRCDRLHTIPQSDVRRTIGRFAETLMGDV
jgi:mRNA interferase MazF